MPPYRCRYIPSDKALVPPPIITTSKLLSAIYSLLAPPTNGKKARFVISILSSVYLQQPQFPGASYLLRLLPPLLDAQVFGHRIGRQISGTENHRPPRIGATAAHKKVLYRRSVVRAKLVRTQVTHLKRMISPLLDRTSNHIHVFILHIQRSAHIHRPDLVIGEVGGILLKYLNAAPTLLLLKAHRKPLGFAPLLQLKGRHL